MKILKTVIISLSMTVFIFLLIEFITRLYFGNVFNIQNEFLNQKNLLTRAYPGIIDTSLGWIPRPNTSGYKNIWGTEVTILNDSTRSNGINSYNPDSPIILAVGDSMTFGDQVSDKETWPAYLEKITKSRVINGGVFNYGIDQILLRTESLIKNIKPHIVIFSFIPRDIQRTGESIRSSLSKPYFISQNAKLKLHTSHIKVNQNKIQYELDFFKKYMGYSLFINEYMMKINPEYWLIGSNNDWTIDNNPVEVSCLIMKRLQRVLAQNNIKGLIMAQYTHFDLYNVQRNKDTKKILNCATQADLLVLDMFPYLEEVRNKDSIEYNKLFNTHMTPHGNSFIAKELNRYLVNSGLLEK